MARTATTAKRKPKPKGRRPGCTPAVIDAIALRVGKGMGKEAAAIQSGVPRSTFHDWMAWGREGREPYSELSERIERASMALQERVSTVLDRSLDSDNEHLALKTATWLGERLWPDVYGKRSDVRLQGPEGGPVQVAAAVSVAPVITADVAAGLDAEQLAALARELLAKG